MQRIVVFYLWIKGKLDTISNVNQREIMCILWSLWQMISPKVVSESEGFEGVAGDCWQFLVISRQCLSRMVTPQGEPLNFRH